MDNWIDRGVYLMVSSQNISSLLRLRVVADAEPGAIARVLERFQNINVIPRRVVVEIGINNVMHIEVDVFGLTPASMTNLTAKIRESISVTRAHWHPV
jgi:hypothetical protein